MECTDFVPEELDQIRGIPAPAHGHTHPAPRRRPGPVQRQIDHLLRWSVEAPRMDVTHNPSHFTPATVGRLGDPSQANQLNQDGGSPPQAASVPVVFDASRLSPATNPRRSYRGGSAKLRIRSPPRRPRSPPPEATATYCSPFAM
jgi:hypothetical protein